MRHRRYEEPEHQFPPTRAAFDVSGLSRYFATTAVKYSANAW